MATHFWGEDDATTLFSTPVDSLTLAEAPPLVTAREPARKPRPWGRPREVRLRRPGPRSPGFGGVWFAVEATLKPPAPRRSTGRRVVAALAIFAVGVGVGQLFVGGQLASLRRTLAGTAAPEVARSEPVRAAEPAPAGASRAEAASAAAEAPAARAVAAKNEAPTRKRRRPRVAAPAAEPAEPAHKAIVKVDELDLTLPDPAP